MEALNQVVVRSTVERIVILAARKHSDIFELGEQLSKLRRDHPEHFKGALVAAGISRRRAYYLIDVHTQFAPFMEHAARLLAIGWTKLKILAPIVDDENVKELMTLAEKHRVRDLHLLARDMPVEQATRCVLLNLTSKQYRQFREAILAHGGKRRGRQLIGQEDALTRILEALKTGELSSDGDCKTSTR